MRGQGVKQKTACPRSLSRNNSQSAENYHNVGLTGTLAKALCITAENQSLDQAWLDRERQAKKPVVIILGQVEELFTRASHRQRYNGQLARGADPAFLHRWADTLPILSPGR